MKHKKSFWSANKLRLTLFRIWFTKNILVFVQVALIISVVLMITGNITAETPLLGKILYPLFSELIDEVNHLATERSMEGWMDFFSIIISISISVSMFMIKTRSIIQSDIKSNSVKRALISAGLYFNSDGKLVKREDSIHKDTNGDGVINEHDGKISSNPFKGLIDSIKEFIVIANADFSGNEKEDKATLDEVMAKAELEATAEGLDALENQMKDKLSFTKEETESEDDEDEIEETKKPSKFINWIKSNFTIGRIKESEDDDEIYDEDDEEEIGENEMDIIENNLDEDAETDLSEVFETEEVKEIVNEIITEEKTSIKKPVQNTSTIKTVTNRDAAVNTYLNRMRGNK